MIQLINNVFYTFEIEHHTATVILVGMQHNFAQVRMAMQTSTLLSNQIRAIRKLVRCIKETLYCESVH